MDGAAANVEDSAVDIVQDLDRLKLLIVFDALLVEGNLGRAAEKLGKTPSAISRNLRQLRDHYGQEVFYRTGKGMIPTPFAESLRLRIRALVSEANALLYPGPDKAASSGPLLHHPPLALNQWSEAGPDSTELARRLAVSARDADPVQRFAGYIAMIGNAAGQTRPMSQSEAEDAFGILLSGAIADAQVGAFLIALRSRGLMSQELAGFSRAARQHSQLPAIGNGPADLDWPAYLSPRAQGIPLFIHAARLVASAGYKVVLHGYDGGIVHQAFDHANLHVAPSTRALSSTNSLAFLPIGYFAPGVSKLAALYPLFMMPNAAHFVAAMLNPGAAGTTLAGQRGGEHPKLHRDTARLLGWDTFGVLSGQRDAAQIIAGKGQDLFLLQAEETTDHWVVGPTVQKSKPHPHAAGFTRLETWQAIWDGYFEPPTAIGEIIETAAVALKLLGGPEVSLTNAREFARELWARRRRETL